MQKITLKTYVVANLAFWAFCAIQYAVLRLWLGPITGFAFLFVALGVGFTLVSLFDCASGFLSSASGEPGADSPVERDKVAPRSRNNKKAERDAP